MPTPFKSVIFDLDGTLVDSLQDISILMNKVLNDFGFSSHPAESYKTFVGNGTDILVERVLPKEGQHLKERILQTYLPLLAKHGSDFSSLYPGIPDLLDWLSERKIPLAILSNKPQSSVNQVAQKMLGKWKFSMALGDRPGLARKPKPDGALSIANLQNIPPSAFVFLGDSNVDMLTSQNAGMFSVGVSWGFRTREELLKSGAALVLEKPMDLIKIWE